MAQDYFLPLLFHLRSLCVCHVLFLLHASHVGLPLGVWLTWGKPDVYVMHLIVEYAKSASTATLCLHALTHTLFKPHLLIQCSAEANEHDVHLGQAFATLVTTCPEDSIRHRSLTSYL